MAKIIQAHSSAATEQFTTDYLRTFARLLDPGLAPARLADSSANQDATRWSLGQSAAFATIASAGLWAVVGATIYFFA